MMKRCECAICALVLCLALTGLLSCEKKAPKKNVENTVGFLLRNDQETFLQTFQKGLADAAAKRGVEIETSVCNGDRVTQVDQLKSMLSDGIRQFIVIAVSTDATEQIAKMISAAGGQAAFVNIAPSVEALKVSKEMYYASSPESAAGQYQAQILDSYFTANPDRADGKNLNIFYYNGEYGHVAQLYRMSGFLDEMKRLGYDVHILAEVGANWIASGAKQATDAWLPQFEDVVNAAVAQNDDMALGAIASLLEYDYVDDPDSPSEDMDEDGIALRIPVLGVDGTDAARKSMNSNLLYATVLQDAVSQAETALDLMVKCKKDGSAAGYKTELGISAAKETLAEPPLNDPAVLGQCFIVPFVPVTK